MTPVDLEVASRTDRGVSARANALTIVSRLSAPSLLRMLNGLSPEVFFTGATEVDREFRVRGAVRRRYRYFEGPPVGGLARWRDAAERFRGDVDVRSFGRGLPASSPALRTIESVTVSRAPGGAVIEAIAPSFVWGMVRKIVGALREVGAGRLPVDRLDDALAGRVRLTLPMAEPEPLVLWDVEYDRPWTYRWSGPNRHQRRWWENEERNLERRRAVLEALTGAMVR